MSGIPVPSDAVPYGTPLSRREAGILAGFRVRLRGDRALPVPAGGRPRGMLAVF